MRPSRLICGWMLASSVLPASAQPCTQPPPAPTGVQAGQQSNGCDVPVQWNAVPGAELYEVWRAMYFGDWEHAVLIGTTVETQLVDSRPLSNQTRYYWVKAANACGVSPFSQQAAGRALPGYPFLPTSLSANDECDGRIFFLWNSFDNPFDSTVRSRVWRSPTPQFANASLILEGFQYYGYYDPAVTPGVEYWYWVQIYKPLCAGPIIGGVSGMVNPIQPPPPSLSATERTLCRAIRVTWPYASCATGYTLLRSSSDDPSSAAVLATQSNRGFLDTQVDFGVAYFYWVRASGPRGQSVLTAAARGEAGVVPPWLGYVLDVDARPGEDTWFDVDVVSDPPIYSVQWYADGVPLEDGDHYSGTSTRSLAIHNVTESDARLYHAEVTNACGSAQSNHARLNVGDFPWCSPDPSDYNQDGGVDGGDVEAFFIDWEQSAYCADVNRDGGVDGRDVETFFNCWKAC